MATKHINTEPWQFSSKMLFCYVAFTVRIGYIYLGGLLDEQFPVRYTSREYEICNAAAQLITAGKSPFNYDLYRYSSPIPAYICTLNIIHPDAMKLVICILDIIIGLLMWQIIDSQNTRANRNRDTYLYILVWFYNPLTMILSTQGANLNFTILLLLQLLTIKFIIESRYILAGIVFGVAMHVSFKFSFVNLIIFYVFIDSQVLNHEPTEDNLSLWKYTWYELTFNRMLFIILSFFSVLATTAFFFKINKQDFVAQTIFLGTFGVEVPLTPSLYNFSIYYLTNCHIRSPVFVDILQLYAQAMLVVFTGQSFYQDLLFTISIQTWCIVIFEQELYLQHIEILIAYALIIAASNGIFSDDTVAVHPEEPTSSNSNTNKVSKPIQKSLKSLIGFLAMLVFVFVIFPILKCLLAYLYEYQGEDTFNKINNLNYGYFIMNVFNVWATIRFHKLTQTNVILRKRIKSKSD